ncbi:Adaptin N terminal region family protein [Histomonas meleagridis]|uniref:Adaptin N terminal region family protein n=1 Tax=Histomonas meleagridis TaxID=135588 RepID=UPI003559D49B|nr:Adaptin N terminal region family protein [Histomonas meleagridis]KAH0799865.1 Adaptin N terminal region family protein [Histomonas meleagridis]
MISVGGDYTSYGHSIDEINANEQEKQLGIDLAPTITQNLQSTKIKDKLNGVKSLLSVMSKGDDVKEFFPLVVQEITSEDETLRHLSYVYLVQYAEADPDSALMSVNTFQRSLSDEDPIVRAMSLKILSSIRSPEIIEIVLDAVQTCSRDASPYVRKAAALALIKIYETDSDCLDDILVILQKLLNDTSVITISGALYALSIIKPDYDELVHPIFRTLCNVINKLDPWGQTIALHILQRYARRNFKRPTATDEWLIGDDVEEEEIDPDLTLLLKCVKPLLSSITPSVTLAACSLIFYCAPPYMLQLIVKPMIRLTYNNSSISYAALLSISSFIADNAEIFVPHIRHFFITFEDIPPIKILKLQILSQLSRPSNSDILLKELALHIHSPDKEVASAAVKAIGRTASNAGDSSINCINVIVKLLSSPSITVISQAVKMLCILLRPLPKQMNDNEVDNFNSNELMDSTEVISVLNKLLSVFNKINDAETKAALVSLIGDKSILIPLQAHEVLRQLTITFTQLETPVKMQTVNLAAKLLCVRPNEVSDLTRYVFTLGYYDNDIDIRDRSRLLHQLLTAPQNNTFMNNVRQKSFEFLFPKKPIVIWEGDIMKASEIEVGSFSQMFGKNIAKNALVQQWADPSKLPPSSVRDEKIIENDDENALKIEQDNEDDLEMFFGPRKEKNAIQVQKLDEDFLNMTEDTKESVQNKSDDFFDL